MPVINYQQLSRHLDAAEKSAGQSPDQSPGQPPGPPWDSLWLIYGEELLRTQALDTLLSFLLPNPGDRMNYEPVGQDDNQVFAGLEKMNTYTFLPGRKVVTLLDCRIFDSPKNTPSLVTKIIKAHAEDDLKAAGRHFIRLLAVLNLSFEDVAGNKRRQLLKLGPNEDDQWIDPVLNHCRDAGLHVPAGTDPSQMLEDAILRGFPEKHHLIIITDLMDRRRRLYKTIEANGMVVDCTVPQGSRKAEKTVQEAVLKERMAAMLGKYDKQMDPSAFQALYEKTGFQPRMFCSNIEKLIDYLGERKRIRRADVDAVLSRSRQDPVFELTNAVSERNLDGALFYLKMMLTQNLHPLQIIAALSNQIRKLIIAREFIDSPHGRVWKKGIDFGHFQRSVMPAIGAFDDELRKLLSDWKDALDNRSGKKKGEAASKGKGKKSKKSLNTRLLLSPGAGNPYPIYKLIQNAHGFTLKELVTAFKWLYESDWRLKTGETEPEMVLDDLLIRICRSKKGNR